jgi:DeoR/GlpR family transcriptional regulator of sugar metabolism
MLARQRQSLILDQVRRHGGVRVGDLTRLLGVSDMTVRRDLEVLASQGLLDKVHGGATTVEGRAVDEPGFEAKSARELGEKSAIGRAAARLVKPGTAIAVTGGTTTRELSRHLADVAGLTVLTNSLHVAQELYAGGRPDQTVIVTGGIRTPSDALVGPVAVATIRSLHVDVVFMGVHGMTERAGFTTPNIMECETNRAFAEHTSRLVVLADHTKWGVVGLSQIAPLDEASVLVTDDALPEEARTVLAETVGELVVVPGNGAVTGRAS